MSEKSVFKFLFYFILSLLIVSSIFQLVYTNKIKSWQQSVVAVQALLDRSDQFSANLGSVQQQFRSYAINRVSSDLTGLRHYQRVVDSVLKEKLTLSNEYPVLHNLVVNLKDVYQAENKDINAYVDSHPEKLSTEESIKAVEKSERGMGVIWTQLFEYRKALKARVELITVNIGDVSAKSFYANIVFLILLLMILLLAIYKYLREYQHSKRPSLFGTTPTDQAMLMRSLLKNTSTSMLIMDIEGKILFVNKAFEDFIGMKESDLIGKAFIELKIRPGIQYGDNAVRMDKDYPYCETEETVSVDGKTLYFFTRKFPIRNENDEIVASGLISRNITERILNEEGLKKSRHEAENAKMTQEQFMANISHEIRTPMNGIMGMTDLLTTTELDSTQREYVQIIGQSSKNLMVLINDILDFSKIEAGKLELERIPFKINDVLNQVISSVKAKVEEKQLPIRLNIDYKVPLGVIGDPLRLYQILSNVLSNAIKFTVEGSVQIDVTANSDNSDTIAVQFKITDTGIGIPEERIGYIFQSFTQTSLDITRKFGGTGLGLAIVKQLVDLYKGTISVSSKSGKGSTFIIEIPFITSAASTRTPEEGAKFGLLKGKKIMVVEDNVINQKVITKTLENSGMTTILCDNGYAAIEFLKQQRVDLIIMDIQMPEIDGRETTMKIRHELGLKVPVIAMTASVLADEREKCKAAGMNEYISKPFVKEDLFEKMLLFI